MKKGHTRSSTRSVSRLEKKGLAKLLLTLSQALHHLLAICIVAGIQRGFSALLSFIMPKEMPSLGTFLDAVMAVMFILIYLSLAYDTAAVFLPWLRRKDRASGESTEPTSSTSG